MENVREAGVVGAGGAGFPTHIKLKSKVDTYIANGAECEPLLRVDQHLMSLYPEKIVRGLQLGMEATGATRGILGIKIKYKQAIREIGKVIKSDNRLEIKLLDNSYPAGDEHILVYEATARLVPEAGLPLDVGVVVNNIETLINIEGASRGIPVTSRYVTVTGAVKQPKTVKFPIGTPIKEAIQLAGGAVVNPFKVVIGGPMMGYVTSDLETPVMKTTSGIIVLPESHYLIKMKQQRISLKVVVTKAACIRCQFCTLVCPRYLLGHDLYPDKIMRAVAWGGKENPRHLTSSFLCVDCGVCTFYGCPMGLDPCKVVQEVKNQLLTEGMTNPHKRKEFEINDEREFRKIPIKRLYSRLNLTKYEHIAKVSKQSPQVARVHISLKQHIGVPAIPTVNVGDKVVMGDLIGKIPDGSLGATIHASISGIVTQIKDKIVIEREKSK